MSVINWTKSLESCFIAGLIVIHWIFLDSPRSFRLKKKPYHTRNDSTFSRRHDVIDMVVQREWRIKTRAQLSSANSICRSSDILRVLSYKVFQNRHGEVKIHLENVFLSTTQTGFGK